MQVGQSSPAGKTRPSLIAHTDQRYMYITVFISGLESAFSPCTSTSSSQQMRFSVLRPRIPLKARLQPISEKRKQANGFMYNRATLLQAL